ncbi:MAG: TetR/AcrR family transcriptional regulator [Pseudoxanthomonas sp.]
MARTGRPRSFDRAQAVDQAMHVFWAHGYESASLARLKDAMGGISSPSFYAAFGSKVALFEEVLRRYLSTHGQVMSRLYDPEAEPRAAVEDALRASARMQTDKAHPPGCLLTLAATTTPSDAAMPQKILSQDRRNTRAGFTACVARAVQRGELPSDTDVASMGLLLETFVRGLTLQARDGISLRKLDAAIDRLMAGWKQPRVRH